jgi:hypothetical protein
MSVKWDVPKTMGQQNTVTEEGLHLFDNVSFYRRKYFIFCELRNTQFKQKLCFQGYRIQNITSLLFMT